MSRKCVITGKGVQHGNNVPWSKKKTQKVWKPNLQKKKFFVPELGRSVTLRVSTHGQKIIDKVGLMAYLRREGLSLKDIT
jgi:large subunit ribosomal protein L28